MKNLSAELKHKIQIEAPVEVADSGGGFTTSWNVVATLSAKVEAYKSLQKWSEPVSSSKIVSVKMYEITIRYSNNINEKMRVVFDGRVMNIRAVIDPDESKKTLMIIAEEGVAT